MEPTRIAIIGAGVIGSIYARICSQMAEVDLAAIHDVDAKRADSLAQELNTRPYSGSSYEDLFNDHPALDGVLVCTPQEHHLQPVLAALEAGIPHLQVEKPLAASIQDAEKIVDAVAKKGAFAMMAYSLRFDPRYVAMKNAVANGEIGDITYIHARRNPPATALERIKGIELPFWVGVHDIDMMRWITGSEVSRLYASSTTKGFEAQGVQAAVLTNLVFENGVLAVLENAWRRTTTSSKQLSLASFYIHGSQGYVEIDGSEQGIRIVHGSELYAPDTVSMPTVSEQLVGVYRNQIASFIRCVRQSKPSPIPLKEGLNGLIVADAILQSIRQGREIIF